MPFKCCEKEWVVKALLLQLFLHVLQEPKLEIFLFNKNKNYNIVKNT